MLIKKVHHVAYRCIDAKQTVEWYQKHLDMKFVLAIAEDEVPSTKAPDPYMHIFLDAGNGNILAFFEFGFFTIHPIVNPVAGIHPSVEEFGEGCHPLACNPDAANLLLRHIRDINVQ